MTRVRPGAHGGDGFDFTRISYEGRSLSSTRFRRLIIVSDPQYHRLLIWPGQAVASRSPAGPRQGRSQAARLLPWPAGPDRSPLCSLLLPLLLKCLRKTTATQRTRPTPRRPGRRAPRRHTACRVARVQVVCTRKPCASAASFIVPREHLHRVSPSHHEPLLEYNVPSFSVVAGASLLHSSDHSSSFHRSICVTVQYFPPMKV